MAPFTRLGPELLSSLCEITKNRQNEVDPLEREQTYLTLTLTLYHFSRLINFILLYAQISDGHTNHS